MAASSGVIRQPLISTEAHVMGASEATYVDPIMASRLDAARQAGYDQGFTDGARAAEAGARRAAETALARLREGVDAASSELRSTNMATVPGLVELAVAIARRIVDQVPDEVRRSMIARLSDALDEIDSDDLVLLVHADDVAEVAAATGDVQGLEVRPDERLRPGDARIESRWCRADLTLATAWQIVEERLDG